MPDMYGIGEIQKLPVKTVKNNFFDVAKVRKILREAFLRNSYQLFSALCLQPQ